MHKILRTLVMLLIFAPIVILMVTFDDRQAEAPSAPPQLKQDTQATEIIETKEETEIVETPVIETTTPEKQVDMVDTGHYEEFLLTIDPKQAEKIKADLSQMELGDRCPKSDDPYKYDAEISLTESVGYYVPDNLIDLAGRTPIKYDSICLDALAFWYYDRMVTQAKSDGVAIVGTSGYRSRGVQNYLYQNSLARNPDRELLSVAKPGHSEHQLGTTIDITSPEINNRSTTEDFDATAAYAWMQANASSYGFYLTYPKGNNSGYIYEPWHWRWLGVFEQ